MCDKLSIRCVISSVQKLGKKGFTNVCSICCTMKFVESLLQCTAILFHFCTMMFWYSIIFEKHKKRKQDKNSKQKENVINIKKHCRSHWIVSIWQVPIHCLIFPTILLLPSHTNHVTVNILIPTISSMIKLYVQILHVRVSFVNS